MSRIFLKYHCVNGQTLYGVGNLENTPSMNGQLDVAIRAFTKYYNLEYDPATMAVGSAGEDLEGNSVFYVIYDTFHYIPRDEETVYIYEDRSSVISAVEEASSVAPVASAATTTTTTGRRKSRSAK